MEGRNNPVIVVGGGASGIIAAISLKRRGLPVVICERMKSLGKKILASGNGRCNLSNDRLDSSYYNPAARPLVDSVFSRFNNVSIKDLFIEMGLRVYSEDGRVFPATNQSASVLKILETELKRLSIPVEYNFQVTKAIGSKGNFTVVSKTGGKLTGSTVILTGGGKSYPSLGSDGSLYAVAKAMGHRIIEPVPAAVPLVVKDELCHKLQGQKISARIKSFVACEAAGESSGDLLFTKYGLSGTAVLDISEEVSLAINRNKLNDVMLSVDMVPFIGKDELADELSGRIKRNITGEDLIVGLLPNKFGPALKEVLDTGDSELITRSLKERVFRVSGTRGWNEADFTAGGVDLKDVDKNSLESTIIRGVYFAGEILDVTGKRGGYNLAWAWASGFIAAQGALR